MASYKHMQQLCLSGLDAVAKFLGSWYGKRNTVSYCLSGQKALIREMKSTTQISRHQPEHFDLCCFKAVIYIKLKRLTFCINLGLIPHSFVLTIAIGAIVKWLRYRTPDLEAPIWIQVRQPNIAQLSINFGKEFTIICSGRPRLLSDRNR